VPFFAAMAAATSTELALLREEFAVEVQRLQAEVRSLKEKLNEKEEKKEEHEKIKEKQKKDIDVFTNKKGFSNLPSYNGKAETYDDWHFKVATFLEIEDGLRASSNSSKDRRKNQHNNVLMNGKQKA
jgi:hypothetical protein